MSQEVFTMKSFWTIAVLLVAAMAALATPVAGAQDRLRGENLTELMAAVASRLASPSGGADGIVVQANGGRVFIDIGTDRGVAEGQEFELVAGITRITHPVTGEVLDETRVVVGRIRVVRAQPKLSICEVIEGEAAAMNKDGEPMQVSRPQTSGPTAVDLGEVVVAPDANLSADRLRSVLIEAIEGTPSLERASGAEVVVNLDASVEGGGTLIELTLAKRESGQRVARSEGMFVSSNALADLGYGGAVVFNAGKIEIPVARNLLRAEFGSRRVVRAGDGLFLEGVGLEGEDCWVLPDGRIIAAGIRPFSGPKALRSCETTAKSVARIVTANDGINAIYAESSQILTASDEQIQILYMHTEESAGFNLDDTSAILRIGSTAPTWANFVFPENFDYAYQFSMRIKGNDAMSKWTGAANTGYKIVPLVPIGPGNVEVEFDDDYDRVAQFREPLRWEFFFPDPDARVRLLDGSGRSVIRKATYSRAIRDAGEIPTPDRLPKWATDDGSEP